MAKQRVLQLTPILQRSILRPIEYGRFFNFAHGMLFLVLFSVSERHSFNITGTETSTVALSANNDVFFLANKKHAVMMLHSIQQVIASVNIHDGQSIIQGYIGRESRSFGIYFGGGKGSISIHATGDTNLTYSVTIVNNTCKKMFVSAAPKDTFLLDTGGKLLGKKANETIKAHQSICFWHAAVGNSVVNMEISLPEEQEGSFVSVTNFNDEGREEKNHSYTMKREYQGSFLSMFKAGAKPDGANVNINIENTTEFVPNNGYRASFYVNQGPQFLMDIDHVPSPPIVPTKDVPTRGAPPGATNLAGIAGFLMGVCLVCVIVMIVCCIFIYKKRQRRKEKEMEALMSVESDDEIPAPHIPRASIPVPRLALYEDAV